MTSSPSAPVVEECVPVVLRQPIMVWLVLGSTVQSCAWQAKIPHCLAPDFLTACMVTGAKVAICEMPFGLISSDTTGGAGGNLHCHQADISKQSMDSRAVSLPRSRP